MFGKSKVGLATIVNILERYLQGGIKGCGNAGGSYMIKTRITTQDELLKIVIDCLNYKNP